MHVAIRKLLITLMLAGFSLSPVSADEKAASETPRPNPLIAAQQTAINQYCKTAARLSCVYYATDAIHCLAPAESADGIYHMVLFWKKQGFSTKRTVEQLSFTPDNAITALAAGKMIDDHDRYDKDAFEMAVMRLCLARITK